MTDNVLGQINAGVRRLVPLGAAIGLVLSAHIPTHLPGFSTITPLLGLTAVYHWSLHRPDIFPSIAAFGLGLLTDALSGAPFGINALIFLAVHGVVSLATFGVLTDQRGASGATVTGMRRGRVPSRASRPR